MDNFTKTYLNIINNIKKKSIVKEEIEMAKTGDPEYDALISVGFENLQTGNGGFEKSLSDDRFSLNIDDFSEEDEDPNYEIYIADNGNMNEHFPLTLLESGESEGMTLKDAVNKAIENGEYWVTSEERETANQYESPEEIELEDKCFNEAIAILKNLATKFETI